LEVFSVKTSPACQLCDRVCELLDYFLEALSLQFLAKLGKFRVAGAIFLAKFWVFNWRDLKLYHICHLLWQIQHKFGGFSLKTSGHTEWRHKNKR